MVKHRKRLIILVLAVIFVFSWEASLSAAPIYNKHFQTVSETSAVEEQEVVITSNTFVKIAEEAQKVVVSILTTRKNLLGEEE